MFKTFHTFNTWGKKFIEFAIWIIQNIRLFYSLYRFIFIYAKKECSSYNVKKQDFYPKRGKLKYFAILKCVTILSSY